jgi:predicted class III extradiol MEMO1 family dioxygenase
MSNAIQVARIRPPAVAGLFYPHDPRELRAVLDDCSAQAARLATPSAARSSMPKALIVPHVVAADFPHAREHSLEVHLPFLQVLLGEFRVLPIATGDATALEVATALECIWGDAERSRVVGYGAFALYENSCYERTCLTLTFGGSRRYNYRPKATTALS